MKNVLKYLIVFCGIALLLYNIWTLVKVINIIRYVEWHNVFALSFLKISLFLLLSYGLTRCKSWSINILVIGIIYIFLEKIYGIAYFLWALRNIPTADTVNAVGHHVKHSMIFDYIYVLILPIILIYVSIKRKYLISFIESLNPSNLEN